MRRKPLHPLNDYEALRSITDALQDSHNWVYTPTQIEQMGKLLKASQSPCSATVWSH
ncbi:hypothetical protein ACFSC4_12410 [Deinococcus malanensis]|uniref:hypothetical protein n=1 Tax=Deinococcus malanensis TaxID=1706855 RepID=UPI0036293B3C